MSMRRTRLGVVVLATGVAVAALAAVSTTKLVVDDPLVRMPGTQPNQVVLEGPRRCQNCHAGYDSAVEPGFNWRGSMMASAARDPLFWACMTVAGQDSIWAIGSADAVDICERCHFPKGWLEGRSEPPNASAMTGDDFDGVQCDFCHRMYDPFFEATADGSREGDDWSGYWDESNASDTPSSAAAVDTLVDDRIESTAIVLFNGDPFYISHRPFSANYTEPGAGQYFVAADSAMRASFTDAAARHKMRYSRFHKSRYFCATCHDVSNPVLANLGADPAQPLPTELVSAHSYAHVERTFSEFMLSDFGQPGGASGRGAYDPSVFATSHTGNAIATCQDCHLPDVVGVACNKQGVPLRPTESVEHPKSGLPLHDMTGGNIWVPAVVASAIPGSPNYDSFNDDLLNQGAATLTLDLGLGLGPDPGALLAGVQRAEANLQRAARLTDLAYSPATGHLILKVVNDTGHKLLSGFPEGRRMFLNVRAYSGGSLIWEVNPYDDSVGTLKGLDSHYSPSSPALGSKESYDDDVVWEMHPSSTLTGESETFHFALADGRGKDNRIPPEGFRIAEAAGRLVEPTEEGHVNNDLFTAAEYAGGYDQVEMEIAPGADDVEVTLYYQVTSREYVEFLRDEINGTASSLPASAYIVQTDPFFAQLAAWGDTIWQLWEHNMALPGAAPYPMVSASVSCFAPTPAPLEAIAGSRVVQLSWSDVLGDDPSVTAYRVYTDDGGFLSLAQELSPSTTSWTATGLSNGTEVCYRVTAVNASCESPPTAKTCVTPELREVSAPGSAQPAVIVRQPDESLRLYFEPILGATGYDLFRGSIGDFAGHSCAAVGITASAGSGDWEGWVYTTVGSPSESSYWLVAAVDDSSGSREVGTVGSDSDGTPRPQPVCGGP